jgi:hypothetical protein
MHSGNNDRNVGHRTGAAAGSNKDDKSGALSLSLSWMASLNKKSKVSGCISSFIGLLSSSLSHWFYLSNLNTRRIVLVLEFSFRQEQYSCAVGFRN